MEINQAYNRELKETLGNMAIGVLMENNLITQEDFPGLSIGMGYLFTTEEQQVEGLFQISFSEKTYAKGHSRIIRCSGADKVHQKETVDRLGKGCTGKSDHDEGCGLSCRVALFPCTNRRHTGKSGTES